jgi:hypothetical protein
MVESSTLDSTGGRGHIHPCIHKPDTVESTPVRPNSVRCVTFDSCRCGTGIRCSRTATFLCPAGKAKRSKDCILVPFVHGIGPSPCSPGRNSDLPSDLRIQADRQRRQPQSSVDKSQGQGFYDELCRSALYIRQWYLQIDGTSPALTPNAWYASGNQRTGSSWLAMLAMDDAWSCLQA